MRPKEKTPPPALTRAPTLRLCVVYSRLGHWASFEETTVLLKITSKTNNLVILQMGKLRPREKTCPGSWESAKPRPRTPTMEVFFLHPHSPKNRKGHGEAKAKVAGGCGGGGAAVRGRAQQPTERKTGRKANTQHVACSTCQREAAGEWTACSAKAELLFLQHPACPFYPHTTGHRHRVTSLNPASLEVGQPQSLAHLSTSPSFPQPAQTSP
jgi:hypothetical protein